MSEILTTRSFRVFEEFVKMLHARAKETALLTDL